MDLGDGCFVMLVLFVSVNIYVLDIVMYGFKLVVFYDK